MNRTIRLIITTILAVAFATSLHGQFETNGPNAALTVQGLTPSVVDPVGHDVEIPIPGIFTFDVASGVNAGMGLILLASSIDPTGAQFATPLWGGSIDVGSFVVGPTSILIVADGIGLSINPIVDANFRTSVPGLSGGPLPIYTQSIAVVGPALCGFRAAIQAIVQDPTNGPIGLDNTEVADANFEAGVEAILLTGDDGVVNVAFSPGSSFPFHGVNYTEMWVCGNGYLSFGGPTSVNVNGFNIDVVSWVTAEPSIAVCINDWSPGQTGPNDGVFYREIADPTDGGFEALVSWGDRRALPSGALGVESFGSPGTVNRFEVELRGQAQVTPCTSSTLAAGEFRLSWPLLDANNLARRGDGVFGHTPGSPTIGTAGLPRSNDLLGQVVTTVPGAASVEEHNDTGLNQSVLGTGATGVPRLYDNFFAATGLEVVFAPTPGAGLPGISGYTSTPSGPPRDDVDGIDGNVLSTTPGSVATIVGKFFGFGAGSVTIVDNSGTTFAGIPAVVSGGTGPLFANEGLIISLPAIAAGPAVITVNFSSGYTESLNVLFIDPCTSVSPFALPNNGFATVTLAPSNGITFYGTLYQQINVVSNGIITFGLGTALLPLAKMFAFFIGIGGVPNPAVGVLWADLNLGGVTSGATYRVIENACSGTVEVVFADQNYAASGFPAGTFSVTFGVAGPDSIRFNYSQILNDPGNADFALVGVSDGQMFGPGFVKTDLATLGGIESQFPGYTSPLPQESVAEDIPTGVVATRLQSINGTGIFTIQISAGILTVF